MKKILLIFALYAGYGGYSQQLVNNKHTQCNNPVPEVFHSSPKEKVIDNIDDLDKNEKRFDRKNKERFILESNFHYEMLYKSGYVCFNDSITRYIETVAQKLLQNKAGLYKQLHFYTLRTSEVNSFCTADGSVFVTQGLLAQLENEAQLAFVLSHEIVHFLKKHAMEAYVKNEQIEHGRGSFRKIESENKRLLKSSYSKENETEADSVGFCDMFAQSGYKIDEALKTFNVLLYSKLPIDEVVFNKSFFESTFLHYSENYTRKEVQAITAVEDYNDTLSSHPNIKKRKEMVLRLTKERTTGEPYLIGKERFDAIKKINQYDLSTLYILERNYASAIYNSYVLLQKDANSMYLKDNIAASLYYLYKYSLDSSRKEVLEKWEDVEGESQQLFYFLQQLKIGEYNQLAFHQLWTAVQRNKSNELLSRMLYAVAIDLLKEQKCTMADVTTAINYKPVDTTSSSTTANLSKYEKIELKRRAELSKSIKLLCLTDLVAKGGEGSGTALSNYFAKVKAGVDSIKAAEDFKETRAYRKQMRRERKRGKSLNIDKIIVFDPFYYKIDKRKKTAVRFFDSEERKQLLMKQCDTFSTQLGLSAQIFDYNALTASDAVRFNDYSVIRLWNDQQSEIGDRAIINYLQYDLMAVTKKYGVSHVAWTGAVAYRKRRSYIGRTIAQSIVLSFYFPPSFLYGIYYAATPLDLCYYTMDVFDCKTGAQVLESTMILEEKETTDIRNSFLYDALNQVKKTK